MIYHKFVKDLKPYENEYGDTITVEEQIERFDAAIGQIKDPEEAAKEKVRAMLIAMGKDPDAEPEIGPELKAKMELDAMRSEQDMFFSGDLHVGKEQRGRKLRPEDNAL